MKTLTLNLVKKNRKYFACLHKGYEVKLLIDAASENLSLGDHELLLDDISVRTKYGTDVIYKVVGETKPEKIVTLQSPRYNKWLVKECQNLGGRWDETAKAWVFSHLVEAEVDELDRQYNEQLVCVDIEAQDDIRGHQDDVTFMGYSIARAFGRDSGAKLGENVALLDGQISSGGSVKNWVTFVRKGSTFRLVVSKVLLDECEMDSDWKIVRQKETN